MSKRTFWKKIWSMCYLSAGGGVVYAGLSLRNNNEKFYRDYLMPVVMRLDPECAHRIAVTALKYNLIPSTVYVDDAVLQTTFLDGRLLSNPLGVAAGFDKHAEAVVALQRMGFGCVEVGSVTPEPQPGNEAPRVFRLPEDRAVINRYGFNSHGHVEVSKRLETLVRSNTSALGINLGKNKTSNNAIDDYVAGVRAFGHLADYLVINISSPNTPGLRNLQNKDELYKLLSNVVAAKNLLQCDRKPYIFLKLAPDLEPSEKNDIVNVLSKKECKVDGLIICNTTIKREGLKSNVDEIGGLSGDPLKNVSTLFIEEMYSKTKGRIPIIGVGGVSSGRDAFEKILAGATVVQIYTSFIYDGPPIVNRIKSELSELLKAHGFQNVNDAVGKGRKLMQ